MLVRRSGRKSRPLARSIEAGWGESEIPSSMYPPNPLPLSPSPASSSSLRARTIPPFFYALSLSPLPQTDPGFCFPLPRQPWNTTPPCLFSQVSAYLLFRFVFDFMAPLMGARCTFTRMKFLPCDSHVQTCVKASHFSKQLALNHFHHRNPEAEIAAFFAPISGSNELRNPENPETRPRFPNSSHSLASRAMTRANRQVSLSLYLSASAQYKSKSKAKGGASTNPKVRQRGGGSTNPKVRQRGGGAVQIQKP